MKQALALPKKARADLLRKLLASLGDDAGRQTKSLKEPPAKYAAANDDETLSQEEWDKAWGAELNKRSDEIKSGKVKCIPLEEARKRWRKTLNRD